MTGRFLSQLCFKLFSFFLTPGGWTGGRQFQLAMFKVQWGCLEGEGGPSGRITIAFSFLLLHIIHPHDTWPWHMEWKVEEMIGSLVSRLDPSTDCIVWRSGDNKSRQCQSELCFMIMMIVLYKKMMMTDDWWQPWSFEVCIDEDSPFTEHPPPSSQQVDNDHDSVNYD